MRLTAMRRQMQAKKLGIPSFSAQDLQSLQLTQAQIEEMARLFAVAKYQDRFVIPTAIREDQDIAYRQGACSLEGIAPKEGQL